ncbi:MAG TPA: hypothetical protein VGO52_26080, partial [Hyphomonadaceae bacterium]|nr:hypothetical protein [Hyphomonadaceae bacterium]
APRAARRDLKTPEREQRSSNFRSDRGSPARKRPTDGGGRPPGVRHSTQKGPGGGGKGKASYGKNKKRKGR